MLIIGLTGSLGTGKTTVAKMFFDRGAKVLDADAITHQLMRPKGAAVKPMVRHFGQGILRGQAIDRKRVSEIVFNDPRQLKKLCQIIHPLAAKEVKNIIRRLQKRRTRQILIIDAPLLIEAGWHRLVDYLVVVRSNQRLQVRRTQGRMNISKAQALKRIKAQMSIREKIRLADIVIDNRGHLTNTKKQVNEIWQKLLRKKQ